MIRAIRAPVLQKWHRGIARPRPPRATRSKSKTRRWSNRSCRRHPPARRDTQERIHRHAQNALPPQLDPHRNRYGVAPPMPILLNRRLVTKAPVQVRLDSPHQDSSAKSNIARNLRRRTSSMSARSGPSTLSTPEMPILASTTTNIVSHRRHGASPPMLNECTTAR